MSQNAGALSQLSGAEKRILLKQLLRQKAAKEQTDNQEAPLDIAEQHYCIEQFPEYVDLRERLEQFDQLGVENPFFRTNDGTVRDTTEIAGKSYICFASYNYLGLSGEKRVSQAVAEAVARYGTSVSASRIATGERPLHRELEQALAQWLGTEDAIAFVSGFGTNVTSIGHLLGPRDIVFFDELSHNSVIQGCLLSGARRMAFRHNDCAALEEILRQHRPDAHRALIVTEGVFSMDGDVVDLAGLVRLRHKYRTLLMVDEAHSIGVLGQRGRGIAEHAGVDPGDVDLWMGTLSKTFASCGGYIAGCHALVQLLKYEAPGFLFSVGLSPANAAAALASLRLLQAEPERVERVQKNSALFLELARQHSLNTGHSEHSPVIPVIVGDSIKSLELAQRLYEDGINVQPILYPAVARDAARLRFFITSEHRDEQIRYTIDRVAFHIGT